MTAPADGLQRAHARTRVAIEVTLESDHNFYAGLTDNISEGGVFVATDWEPRQGTEVDLELSVAGETFQIHGVVRWMRGHDVASDGLPAGCGICWLAISEEALAAIHRFVAQRETLFFEH